MLIIEWIFGAIAFILTAGLIGRDRFGKDPLLMTIVIVLSVVGTIGSAYALRAWVVGMIDERMGGKPGPETPLESIRDAIEAPADTRTPSTPKGYFTITDRLARKQVSEKIDVVINGVVQGTFDLDRASGRTSATIQFAASDSPVRYALSGTETDTLEGFERTRSVSGGGRIDSPHAGMRYEFQPVRPFTIAPGETPPSMIEEKIVPSR